MNQEQLCCLCPRRSGTARRAAVRVSRTFALPALLSRAFVTLLFLRRCVRFLTFASPLTSFLLAFVFLPLLPCGVFLLLLRSSWCQFAITSTTGASQYVSGQNIAPGIMSLSTDGACGHSAGDYHASVQQQGWIAYAPPASDSPYGPHFNISAKACAYNRSKSTSHPHQQRQKSTNPRAPNHTLSSTTAFVRVLRSTRFASR